MAAPGHLQMLAPFGGGFATPMGLAMAPGAAMSPVSPLSPASPAALAARAPLEVEVYSASQQRWNRAQVVQAKGGFLVVTWSTPDGRGFHKQIPEGHETIRWLEVEVFSTSRNRWDRAQVVRFLNGVLTVSWVAADGQPLEKQLPWSHQHVRPCGVEDPRPWLEAARNFSINADFDIMESLASRGVLSIGELFSLMKQESGGKRTIQALGDKIILSQMLDNLRVPQMPMLFTAQREVDRAKVYALVESLEQAHDDEAFDVVVKPTHMSNGTGAVIFDRDRWLNEDGGWSKQRLYEHMKKYLAQQADDGESEALKSLIPGIIVQPRYRSVLDFRTPLEIRVVTLWGKTRLGIWWWGRGVKEERRNTWLIRHPLVCGELGANDTWEILHEHMGDNPGFEQAVELFRRAMPVMSAVAESMATAVGAPFLRSDFFVGSDSWGVRLNEVAYGSGTHYRQRPVGSQCLVDDGPTIARILQEGFSLCRKREPPETFLAELGATGQRYENMKVTPLDRGVQLPDETVEGIRALDAEELPTPMAVSQCTTMSVADVLRVDNSLQGALERQMKAHQANLSFMPGPLPQAALAHALPQAPAATYRSPFVPLAAPLGRVLASAAVPLTVPQAAPRGVHLVGYSRPAVG